MPLSVRDLARLPKDAPGMCELADELVRDWLPSVELGDSQAQEFVAESEARLGSSLPSSLRWAYERFGLTGGRLFRQDPLVHVGVLNVDQAGMVVFRTEQQGCATWGYSPEAGDDPAVFVRLDVESEESYWELFQDRLSIHLFEAVLDEAMLGSGHAANLDPQTEALAALHALPLLGIPSHRMWTAPETGVEWRAFPEVVVRSDADAWLWALARTGDDLGRLMTEIPGDWQVHATPDG